MCSVVICLVYLVRACTRFIAVIVVVLKISEKMDNSPLFNHLVLEKILDNLDLSDLKSCRLVCTFWNDIAISRIIQEAEFCLEGERLNQFLSFVCQPESPNQQQNSLMSAPTPFETFKVKIGSVLSTSDTIQRIWSAVHHPIKYLTLHVTTLYAHTELEGLLINHLPNLVKVKLMVMKYWGSSPHVPLNVEENRQVSEVGANANLRHFQLCYLGFDDGGERDEFSFPIEWRKFFSRFPAIIHLSLIGLSNEDISKMITALAEVQMQESAKVNLKSLEILDESIFPEAPTDDHFIQIASLGNIESFHFEISPVTTAAALNLAIGSHASSLQSLRLRRYPHPYLTAPITLTSVILKFVTFLEVSDTLLPSLLFLPFIPALQRFHIILRDYRSLPCCEIMQNTSDPSRVAHLGVKHLYIEPPLISTDCITKLAICFPRLESLRLRVNNEMLGELCSQSKEDCSEAWNCLQTLYITSWDGLTDEGIIGISEQILELQTKHSNFDAQILRTNPYIGFISALSTLTIEMWSDYENHIGDWSVYYGVLDLKKLRDVTFIRSGISSTAFHSIPLVSKRLLH